MCPDVQSTTGPLIPPHLAESAEGGKRPQADTGGTKLKGVASGGF